MKLFNFEEEKKKEKKEFSPIGFKEPKKKDRILDRAEFQTGKSNVKRDKKRDALPAGKRISKSGKVYYEYRKNRSDLKGKKV